MERAATAEALLAQLQASADHTASSLSAIDAFIEQFAPALTEELVAAEDDDDSAGNGADTDQPIAG